jgi:hypothetical protein
MTKQRKVPSGYRMDADKKRWLQDNGGITPLIDRALGEAGYFERIMRMEMKFHIQQRDHIIFDAISHALGRSDWELYDVMGRGNLRTQKDTGREWFSFDGVDLIQFEPPEFSQTVELGATTAHIQQSYRLLYNPADIGGVKP